MHRAVLVIAAIIVSAALTHSALAAPQPTEIPGVTAQLTFLRQYQGVLHLGILFRNDQDQPNPTKLFEFAKINLVDAKGRKKYFPLKGADGQYLAGPVSDAGNGGRWSLTLPPRSEELMWVLFDAVPPGTQLDVNVPLTLPFDKVEVAEGAPSPPQEEEGMPPLRAQFISAERSAGQLKVQLKVANSGKQTAAAAATEYQQVYVLDPQGKRKYPLVKDSEGKYLAIPRHDDSGGGRFWLNRVAPGGQAPMALVFQAPPDSVQMVDMIIPHFRPFEAMPMTGSGGAPASGIAVAGASTDLEQVLKDLKADVTPQQIKVNLSADVLFDFDKADLKPQAQGELQKVVVVLKSNPGAKVTIEGHTDGKGADDYNQTLSEKRAQSVAQWLENNAALNGANVQTRGWGKTKPIAPNQNADGNDNPEGRQKNRRVEITIIKG